MAVSPERFAGDLKRAWGSNLVSVVLYGSAAAGKYDARYSDYNLLLVVRKMTGTPDRKSARLFRRWASAGNPAPLVMTREFMRSSADVFPIEWADIMECRRIVSGPDPLRGLRLKSGEVRAELERELKGSYLRLHGKYRLAADDPDEVRRLMVLSSSTFLTLFRAYLRLLGVRPLPDKADAAKALARKLRIEAGAFEFIESLRAGGRGSGKEDPALWFRRYANSIQAVIAAVDGMKTRGRDVHRSKRNG